MGSRADYKTWLCQGALHQGAKLETNIGLPASELSDDATLWINCLFANLMVVIRQELVHAFVHLHAGNRSRANAAWEISGAAMMQATQVTRLLANRGVAPAPHLAILSSYPVHLPRVALESDQALERDRTLAGQFLEVAGNCMDVFEGTEFETVVRGKPNVFPERCSLAGRRCTA